MWKVRYYCLIWKANGAIAFMLAPFGPFENTFYPIQIYNERWQEIPQPYPDQPGTVRDRRVNYNTGVWFVNPLTLPPYFLWKEITEQQWAYVRNAPWCWRFDGAEIALRPGHVMNDRRNGAFCQHLDYLKMCHTAFGGMPIYQIRHWSKRRPEDFPLIQRAGLFHPWWKEPTPVEIHSALRVQRIALEEGRPLAAHPQNQGQIAQAVGLEKQAHGLVVVPRGYVGGMGTN